MSGGEKATKKELSHMALIGYQMEAQILTFVVVEV